ncbi:pilus assembly protein [Rhodobacteraceae bacterium N5(2021)]|uniref:Pilus assembly protein n=1 Tax=Gymnodinialimonas phycosphaerae TaxID=2841589 RepID=A0A975TRP0_9RHOB|nr:TadE/TadG family type IV pilus assembly protein [Gymnodinialimonas phycosphaerae]MBY4893242.1 pilus assembly protein [Gymnodinialimonas phycosphaerae]
MMFPLRYRVKEFWEDQSATATLEFVIVFPLLMIVFIAAFETALILTRQIMLERTLDMSTRVLRLAQGVITDADTVRDTMCANTNLLPNCDTLLTIDLQIIDRDVYDMPSNDQVCAGRGEDIVIAPDNEFQVGADNDFLLIRTCLIVDRILPFSGFGLNLTRDDSGGMHMMASTIFVNEPD